MPTGIQTHLGENDDKDLQSRSSGMRGRCTNPKPMATLNVYKDNKDDDDNDNNDNNNNNNNNNKREDEAGGRRGERFSFVKNKLSNIKLRNNEMHILKIKVRSVYLLSHI